MKRSVLPLVALVALALPADAPAKGIDVELSSKGSGGDDGPAAYLIVGGAGLTALALALAWAGHRRPIVGH